MTPRPWRIKEILDATGGILLRGEMDVSFSDISIDSRKIGGQDIFVAIRGERFDGHDFIPDVLNAGVKSVVIEKNGWGKIPAINAATGDIVCVVVENTIVALGDLARFRRQSTPVKVAAITGSNGKTTTKEMTAAVLCRRFDVLPTPGNFNNEIGLPLTLFSLNPGHQWAVLELGMNHPGEIGRLADICEPDIGIITNVGPSHLEGLGSVDAIARAKGELLEKIVSGGTAVLNADDPRVLALAEGTRAGVLFYGQSEKAVIRGENIENRGNCVRFELVLAEERVGVTLNMPGMFMVSNALAAAAAGYLAGLSAEEIKDGLESVTPVKGRMNIHKTVSGLFIIDDTYNANPNSTAAAISTLASLSRKGRSAAVLGDMLELGDSAKPLHADLGKIVSDAGIGKLFLYGQYADTVARGAVAAGMEPDDIFCGTRKELLGELKNWGNPGDWILIKGSRSMHMEVIVENLLAKEMAGGDQNRYLRPGPKGIDPLRGPHKNAI
jgi:UDP-N-acetylmuramoyl-tripeptide--D-alanyl-D-alanine ligase